MPDSCCMNGGLTESTHVHNKCVFDPVMTIHKCFSAFQFSTSSDSLHLEHHPLAHKQMLVVKQRYSNHDLLCE